MTSVVLKQTLVLGAAVGLIFGSADTRPIAAARAGSHRSASAASVSANAARAVMLLGDRRVERSVKAQPSGRSQAFAFKALRSGSTTSISLYVASATHAHRVSVAIYGSAHGRPAGLMAGGSTRHVARDGWIRVGVRAKHLRRGSRYWIAVLGSAGRLAFRGAPGPGCSSRESADGRMSHLPSRWRSGRRRSTCRISAFVAGQASTASSPPTKPPGSPTPPTSPAPPPPPAPPTPPTSPAPTGTNCVGHPSAAGCGYPDQSNTGVPAGMALTPSGNISAGAGATITQKDVNGTIEVTGNGVTIKDVRVTNSGDSSSAIHVDGGVTGTTIEDSTLRGAATSNAIQYAVTNGGNGTKGLRLQMYNCTECWSGNGTLQDSYAISNGVIAGAHYEAVYIPGGSSEPTTIEHDTLLNPNQQTAGIFGDDHAYGPMHNVTIDNNLVADGGDNGALVTGCDGDGNTNMVITNNRLSYTYAASMSQGSSNTQTTTWSNNYRDDTLKAIRVTSSC
jgi:hypothetical protein